jgi:hypothetical protein
MGDTLLNSSLSQVVRMDISRTLERPQRRLTEEKNDESSEQTWIGNRPARYKNRVSLAPISKVRTPLPP